MTKTEIYLDNSTAAKPSEKALAAMLPFLTQRWGVPSSPHHFGQQLWPTIADSYRDIYALIGAQEEDDFVFTASGAEAVNQVVFSAYYEVTRRTGKNHFLCTQLDEAPALMAINRLEGLGCVAKMVMPNKEGQICAKAVAEAISPRTALLSMSWANGLTGVIHPVADIAALCQDRGILLHLEASHVLGKLFYDLKDLGPHYLTFSAEMLHAPKSSGGLWIKKGVPTQPLIAGGLEQGGYRAGAFDVASFAALGVAAKEALDARDLLCTEVARLRHVFEEGILRGDDRAYVFYRDQEGLPHCTAIAFAGIPNEAMLYSLNRRGVYASIGGGYFQQIGLLLTACGVDETLAHSTLSFSLSRETTQEEVEQAVEIIVETAKRLRKQSMQFFMGEEKS